MSGRMIITLTGGIKLFFRFFNRLLGFLVMFTGLWFWLLIYGTYKAVVTYNLRLRFSAWTDFDLWIGIGAAVVSLLIFAFNCYKFYNIMPDNIITRLIRSIFERDYRPEREGNNVPAHILKTGNHEKSGFFFGVKLLGFFAKRFFVVKSENEDGHILVVGGAGSGKSACIAKNTLETWNAPIVAVDIKGELSAHYKSISGSSSRSFFTFDPARGDGFIRYDPYYLLHHGGEENLIQNAREIALAIIPLPPNVRDPFWLQAAQNLLTAAILYYFDLGGSFTDTMTAIQTTPIEKLIDEISESENTAAKMYVNTARDLKLETLAGIATELSNKIMVFATDPLIRAAMCDSRTETKGLFSWENANNISIFLRIPEDKLEQWASVTTLMLNQLFRTLERRADKGADGGKVKPVLIMLDEAARLGKIETIKNALATLRSKSVTICLIVQSLAQLDEIYGRDARRTIVDNCAYKAILSATDADSQDYFSRLVGTCEVEKESRGVQYDVDDGIETGRGSHWSKHREPIIFPHEFAKLKDIVMVTPEGFCRVDKVYAPRPNEPLPKNNEISTKKTAEKTLFESAKTLINSYRDRIYTLLTGILIGIGLISTIMLLFF